MDIFKKNSSPVEVLNLIKSTSKRLFPFLNSSVNEDLKFEDCEYLPVGWKRARNTFSGENGESIHGYFLYQNPDGNLFPSEGSVLRNLIRAEKLECTKNLRLKLLSDGWKTNETLPESCMFRTHEFGTAFMDPMGNVYIDSKDFLSSLRRFTSSPNISKIQEEFKLSSSYSSDSESKY